ncbi:MULTISPECIES: xanthine dehydrogenase family protein molybdopterin-binding subunit [Pseudonocardia]|uniref:Caffeine dehydrogenase subunit alpha n=2 Tax=Pseudonocardia TaxID=1847 RepID=A0A1Y2N6Y7_PSEAH|nr:MULTISPECIES: xanthine dehydrogenase family protein molybdopterin-binding subunit [Pseudonocardia]OSY43223.1 Caffeine dehydrogenase subunit alpha [Pseudonocardia autotrophica]TDN71711.1 carbon-monoxide dehydrogenase large subunit [Pseudonocardia autotrophica]BBG02398.1 aldehyde dehydrogenase [Pseudonocardia autotrophica]GEC23266.1 aldehyde dehydrogenase [Pseudonocardia saturnea]
MTATEQTTGGYVGRSIPSRTGDRFVRGAGRYVDDVHHNREATLVVLRSPHAHARIVSVDTSAARAMDGVYAVATGAELFEEIGPQQYLWDLPGQKTGHGRPLTVDKVRHVGEPVAVVVARDQYVAEDARDAIGIVYEPLPAVTTMDQALAPDAPLLHEEWGDNVQVRAAWPVAIPGLPEPPDAGAALAGAHTVVRETFTTSRILASSMETRGVVCDYDPTGPRLTIHTSTQSPHQIREGVAAMLGVPENRIRVIAPDVGGAFGMKAVLYPEEALVPYFALRLRRPVRFTEQRDEAFVASTPSRDQRMELEIGFDADARIVGLRARYLIDLGSAPSTCGAGTGWATGALLCGPYAVPAVDIAATAVVTNKTPLGAYRGFGQPEANFPVERLLDIAAPQLGLDPVELRRRNLVPPEAFPFTTATGQLLDSGDYPGMLGLALDRPAYRDMLRERDEIRAAGRPAGIGIAYFNECTNFGPSGVFPLIGITTGGWDATSATVEPDGRVRVVSSQTPMGQDLETAFAQLAADRFGVPLDHVTVRFGDTDSSHYTAYASGASRAAGIGGSSLILAADKAIDKMRRIAAHLLEADPDDVEHSGGEFRVRGAGAAGLSYATVAAAAYQGGNLPEGMEPGLETLGAFDPQALAFSYGVVVALVAVDPDTGQVGVPRMIFGHDCGTQLNPRIVDAQIVGGALQGQGAALTEEIVYDESGQPGAVGFADYLMPIAREIPELDVFHTVTPTPFALNGAKGVGESGVIAAPSAIVNALQDALPAGAAPLTSIPVLPERVLAALATEPAR